MRLRLLPLLVIAKLPLPMELLLVTPVSSRALWEGHLAAMRAVFLRPFLLLGAGYVGLAAAGGIVVGGDWPSRLTMLLAAVGLPAVGVVVHGCDFLAVAHHASRWALVYDRPWKAWLRTAVMMLALPGLFCSYGRVVVDLVVIGQERPRLEAFRELVRRWYFPDALGPGWGTPRT